MRSRTEHIDKSRDRETNVFPQLEDVFNILLIYHQQGIIEKLPSALNRRSHVGDFLGKCFKHGATAFRHLRLSSNHRQKLLRHCSWITAADRGVDHVDLVFRRDGGEFGGKRGETSPG